MCEGRHDVAVVVCWVRPGFRRRAACCARLVAVEVDGVAAEGVGEHDGGLFHPEEDEADDEEDGDRHHRVEANQRIPDSGRVGRQRIARRELRAENCAERIARRELRGENCAERIAGRELRGELRQNCAAAHAMPKRLTQSMKLTTW